MYGRAKKGGYYAPDAYKRGRIRALAGMPAPYLRRTHSLKFTPKPIAVRGTYKTRYASSVRHFNSMITGPQMETKYVDVVPATNGAGGGATIIIPAAGVILNWFPQQNAAVTAQQSMNQIPQGTTKNTRIGNKTRIRTIRGHLTFQVASGNSDGDVVRMILYKDKQCNGLAVTTADILEYASINSFRAMDYIDQVDVLLDKTFVMNPLAAAANSSNLGFFHQEKFSLKVNEEIHWNNTTGVLGGIVSNNFGMCLISELGNAQIQGATAAPGYSTVRLYFKDQ